MYVYQVLPHAAWELSSRQAWVLFMLSPIAITAVVKPEVTIRDYTLPPRSAAVLHLNISYKGAMVGENCAIFSAASRLPIGS